MKRLDSIATGKRKYPTLALKGDFIHQMDDSSSNDTSDEEIEEFFERKFSSGGSVSQSSVVKQDAKNETYTNKVGHSSHHSETRVTTNDKKFEAIPVQKSNKPQNSPVKKNSPKKARKAVRKPEVPKRQQTNSNDGLFEAEKILITGLNNKTTEDSVSNYIELLSNEDVTSVTLLEKGKALIITNKPIDFAKCSSKVAQRTLNGSQPRIEQVRVCNQILVSGLSPKTTHDTIELYFENTPRSGGGEVENVDYDKENLNAVVTFKDTTVIDVVIARQHNLVDHVISVQKYYPGITVRPSSPTRTRPIPPVRKSRKPPAPEEKPLGRNARDEDFPDMEILDEELLNIDFPEEEKSGVEKPDSGVVRIPGAKAYGVKLPGMETPPVGSTESSGVEVPVGEASPTKAGKKQKAKETERSRECVEVEVDSDVMQCIMGSGPQRECLVSRLGDYKAEVEWGRGDDKARIYKKKGCGYVKKWAESCKRTITEFLDKFDKVNLPVEEKLHPNMPVYLRAGRIQLPHDKALCRLNEAKTGLIVVCLEEEANKICGKVRETLKALGQEELRKAYKKETVIIDDPLHFELLEKMNFVGDLTSKHPELEITSCKEKHQLYFEGPKEQFSDAKIQYFQIMRSLISREFAGFPTSQITQIALSDAGRSYIDAKLGKQNMQAILTMDESAGIKIAAVSSHVLDACEQLFTSLFMKQRVSFQPSDAVIFESKTWRSLLTNFQDNNLLHIELDTVKNTVDIQGVSEYVAIAKSQIQQYIEEECTRSEQLMYDDSSIRLLDQHHDNQLRQIEKDLATYAVKIEVDQQNGSVLVHGTRDGVQQGRCLVENICDGFVTVRKEYSNPGEGKLLLGEKGKRNLKVIQADHKVIIDVNEINRIQLSEDGEVDEEPIPVDPVPNRYATTSRHVLRGAMREETPQQRISSTGFVSPSNIKVSWKFGHIERETADVLVNSATNNLQKLTACGKALTKMGGAAFTQACAPHVNVPTGSIVTTSGGSLSCQNVIHAVCGNWDNGAGRAEQLLCSLLSKIFAECDRIGATSLALPLIGCGGHHYPGAIVAKAYDSQINTFATGHPNTTLKKIRVIVYRKNAQLDAAITSRIPGASTAVQMNDTVDFGGVTVRLRQGDVTTQPFVVDATVNILDTSRKLANGGGINQALLRAGGATIQAEIDSTRMVGGAVLVTSAGNISNIRHIFHMMPSAHDINTIQRSLEACFHQAHNSGWTTISVPALGTASFNITAVDSAKLILKAAENLSRSNYGLKIYVIVFQPNMMNDFQAVFSQNTVPGGASPGGSSPGSISPGRTSPVTTPFGGIFVRSLSPRSTSPPRRQRPKKKRSTRDNGEAVELTIHGGSRQSIDDCITDVDKFVDEYIASKEIDHESAFDVLDQDWSEVERMASAQDVHITVQPSPPLIKIQGQVANVADCQEKLNAMIISYVEEVRVAAEDDLLHQAIGWSYTAGGTTREFSKASNGAIERAHRRKQAKVTVTEQRVQYQIDLVGNTRTNTQTGVRDPIQRKQKGVQAGNTLSVPQHWAPQPSTKVVQLVPLTPTSQEYQQVYHHFVNKGGQNVRVIKIERIQNPILYKAYLAKKQAMSGGCNEMQLFHGTSSVNSVQINTNNFSRSYAGANATMYGNGVYFARDSSYSLRYSQNRQMGAQSIMYVAKVLVGKYTSGASGMKAPPSLNDPNNPGLLYDSVVNNPSNPSIFVIFLDHQCYPEYLITFT